MVTLVSLWGYLYSCWSPWSLSLWGYLYSCWSNLVSLWGYFYSCWLPWPLSGDIFTAASHPGLSLGISLQLMATLVSLSGDIFTAAGHPGISLGYLYNCWSPWSLSGDIFTAAGHPGLSLGISLQQLVTLVYLWGYLFNLEICRGKNCFSLSLTITM